MRKLFSVIFLCLNISLWGFAETVAPVTTSPLVVFNGSLYALGFNTAGTQVQLVTKPFTSANWSTVGTLTGLTALASFKNALYVADGTHIWSSVDGANFATVGSVSQISSFYVAGSTLIALTNHFGTTSGRGDIYQTQDGKTWSKLGLLPTTTYSEFSYLSGTYILVGGDGTLASVWTSSDANQWTQQTSDAAGVFTSLASNGAQYVVATPDGILESTDLHSWSVAQGGNWYRIAWTGSEYISIGTTRSVDQLATSTDGVHWTTDNGVKTGNPNSMATGTNSSIVSYNGTTWIMDSGYLAEVGPPPPTGPSTQPPVDLNSTADIQGQNRFINISTRCFVGTGTNVAIVGFILERSATVLIRGIGPSLAAYGVAGVLPHPQFTVYQGSQPLYINAGWDNDPTQANLITTASTAIGAFALPAHSGDAAMLVTLPAGGYTAVLNDVNGSTGAALLEVYLYK